MASTSTDPVRGEQSAAERETGGCLRRAPWRQLTHVQVLATGGYVPSAVVSNDDLAALGYDKQWIVQRTGIHHRRHAPQHIATSDMAAEAALRCLKASDCDVDDIDLILVATMTPDHAMPSTACLLQERLGLSAPAMDLNAACAGFMYAFVTGMQYIKGGGAERVLVVGADTNSRILDPQDKKTYPLFGDGAGAVLLGPGNERQGAIAYSLGADGRGANLLRLPGGGSRMPLSSERLAEGQQFVQMDGRSVFKWAVRLVTETIREVTDHAQLTVDQLDLIVLHQANIRIIDAAAEALDLPRDRLVVNLDRFGNTSAGSIPLALDEACRAGRVRPGSRVLLCGFGGGLAWGSALLRW